MIKIAIVNYPNALKSALYGLEELFLLANGIRSPQLLPSLNLVQEPLESDDELASSTFESNRENAAKPTFEVSLIDWSNSKKSDLFDQSFDAVIIPPSLGSDFYLASETASFNTLNLWLIKQHKQGAILSSACAGAFLLANTRLLDDRPVTTHWQLSQKLKTHCPKAKIEDDKILINDKDIITAGGLMAWLDLGLELVSVLTCPSLMRQLGKQLVVDTGHREQAYYQVFKPNKHSDQNVLACQHYIQQHHAKQIKVGDLTQLTHLTERTLLRRFQKHLQLSPSEYIQNTRIQSACDLLESSNLSVESIAQKVGYLDTSAYRKAFNQKMGLSPSQFRHRFAKRA
ncbi:GlxA family transcriptional regulator [Marinomonas sp. PE14-40]|uniref:GlxA family transcriptional regulator n=1 Tax=Marinomonas sp. PE14-40 TaxID=3060621 RepID=UPI003F67E2BF